jgi:hypothetical protein
VMTLKGRKLRVMMLIVRGSALHGLKKILSLQIKDAILAMLRFILQHVMKIMDYFGKKICGYKKFCKLV